MSDDMAAKSGKDVVAKLYKMIPPMLESFHKGTFCMAAGVNDWNRAS